MSRQTRRAVIILIGVFVILMPLALILVNQNTNLSGAAIVGSEPAQDSAGDNNPPPSDDNASPQQDTSGGQSSAAQPTSYPSGGEPAPTTAPATPVPPTPLPPTVIPPTDVPPTAVPPTQTPAPETTQEANVPAEATSEPVVDVIPTAELTEEPTLPPEATPEVEITPEATSEFELTPEATVEAEITPEATEVVTGFDVSAACTGTGVDFTITNLGDDMSAGEIYLIDGAEAGSVQLASGASQTVSSGYGSPVLSIGGSEAAVNTPCTLPPQLSVTMECTIDSGVIFTVTNAGGAMESEQDYSISVSGAETLSGTFQLGAGESTVIQAGYGEPSFSSGDLQAQMSPACELPAHVKGRVWQDLNSDGLAADDEPGIAGVIVSLTNDDGGVVQAVTTEDGHYDFFPVGAGHYTVDIQADSLSADLLNTADPDGEIDAAAGVNVDAGGDYTLDFGYQAAGTASVSGFVWLETGNFGVRDSSEKGLAGVHVQLLDVNGAVAAEMDVNPDGTYRFEKLSAGNYTVQLVVDSLPKPYGVSFDSDGDLNIETFVALGSGQTVENIDFGIVGTF